ncbi:DUF4178 domain-containing protein [Sphingomonas profundi]|uniref:DUF4178 domain-containing protein n=1 Tax=Alterirhizorhabdus profundi TaxID=2681549 RepID=UPI0012E96A8F|nr:DUF4178 domain-containing protein [Sphingomonas profundi]
MLTANCPSCGAEVIFRSPALPVVVCAYCQSLVTRVGDDLEAVGKAAALPFDVSPIRLGTTGRFGDRAFEVIGRVRWGWTDGSWNEWLLLFADGGAAWLGEAMGQYMLLEEHAAESGDALVRRIAGGGEAIVGGRATIDGRPLTVSDARRARCIAAEGELPFRAPPGWTIYSVDLRGEDGSCASIQRDAGEVGLYLGRYVTLAELATRNLRAIEGWAMPSFAA